MSRVMVNRDALTAQLRDYLQQRITREEGYSVEFFDMTGNTVAVVTVPAGGLRMPTQTDRPAVRALTA